MFLREYVNLARHFDLLQFIKEYIFQYSIPHSVKHCKQFSAE